MPRTPSLSCADCGKPMWKGSTSAPQGTARCRPCRNPTGHGSSQYRRGCRCDECRAAVTARLSAYVERYRAEHGENPSTTSRRRRGWPDAGKGGQWISPKRRYAIYDRDNWTCGLCGDPVDRVWSRTSQTSPTLDHIVPQSQGGSHDESNLTTAHAYCNAVRQTREFTEFVIWAALEKQTLQAAMAGLVRI